VRSAGEVGDLVLLSRITEEEIVATLERRFKSNDIYTYIGSVLLSVNPFKNISGLYGPQQIRQYRGRYLYELPPHIYAIAECKACKTWLCARRFSKRSCKADVDVLCLCAFA
jgi:myosin-1